MQPSDRHHNRLTAALLVAGALILNIAFTGLGAAFDYPDVLTRPAGQALAEFRADQAAIVAWFALLCAGAALLTPIALRVGRLGDSALLRAGVPVGIAASAVQLAGLVRWPLLVPFLAARAESDPGAIATFTTANTVLGVAVGETLGYALTATWTAMVALALHRTLAGTWFTALGFGAAALIATGVFAPLDLPGAEQANFAGYLLWSAWLVAFAGLLAFGRRTADPVPAYGGSRNPQSPRSGVH
ncbi:DUF4386 family protein [Rhodococcus maanshanensis]|uniref:DUF4386 domain-containing protein n=1 Tax=Rhodococcus maanshanensis TaxID=183556 RepID=A0A1H7NK41_9NOCA|nr:DUF4386 family protein [Rhodococcus maanshanensis]SEL23378.1 protein of unknown function [Rhodococcus maanshanensis]